MFGGLLEVYDTVAEYETGYWQLFSLLHWTSGVMCFVVLFFTQH